MDRVRLGLVGCGSRGIAVAGHFARHPQCDITALMDVFPEAAERAASALALPDAVQLGEYDPFLDRDDVDAVFIAGDPRVQVEMACRAMRAGKHVCTEVPAAFTIEECWNLINTVRETGCQYQLMEQTRYWGFVEAWTEMHRQGEFGHICFAQGEYIHYEQDWNAWINRDTGEMCSAFDLPADWSAVPSWRYELFSDPIYYLPHTLSPLLKVLDDRVDRVSCMGTRPQSYSVPDEEVALPWRDIEYALMHTSNDTVMTVGAGFCMPSIPRGVTGAHWYDIRGTRASVESPRSKDDCFRLWRAGGDGYETTDLSTVPLDAGTVEAQSGHGGADMRPVGSFVRAVQTGEPPEMDVYRAVDTAAPAILAAESARSGGTMLRVPDFRSPDGAS